MRTKTAPLPVDLLKTKRGIVFSLNLSSSSSASTPRHFIPHENQENIENIHAEQVENSQVDNMQAVKSSDAEILSQAQDHQIKSEMSLDDDDHHDLANSELEIVSFAEKAKVASNPSSPKVASTAASPTNSISSSKRSRTTTSDDLSTSDIATESHHMSKHLKSIRPGYDLEVAVHKVTSTTLLHRMHSQNQKGKYGAPLDPSLWPASMTYVDRSSTDAAFRKKKMATSSQSMFGECNWCGVKKTAQWRKGPTGPRGLCNVTFHDLP